MTQAGERLGAYELLRPLGAGGMAETFVAMRRGPAGFEQKVCLKRILPGCAADPLFVELFLDEARLLARLQCNNIVHVHDFGEVSGTYYMALELIEGVDLDGLMTSLRTRGERMPEQTALYIISELLAALSYAHTLEIEGEAQHIVHRDISPSNILLSKHGEVKLTDFGIAKSRGRSHQTQAGHTKGKIAYMSPEQVRAEELDGRSDLFAVGVVLFELLTGEHPFDANTDFALQVNIMSGKRRSLRELLPQVSASIATLVDTLLATDRADRPKAAADAIALIPPLDNTFTLQKGLAVLVKQRVSGAGSSATTGSAPLQSARDLSVPTASSQLASHATVTARGTTTSKAPQSRALPALAIAVLVLVLGASSYAFLRREPAQTQASGHVPALPSALPSPAVVAPPAAPAAPTSTAPRAAEPARGPDGERMQQVETATPAADAPRADSARERTTRTARHASKRAGKTPPAAPASADITSPSGEPEERVREAPVEASPSAPTRDPSVAPPPGSKPDNKNAAPRTTYVTPSGRVVIPAPPL